MRDRQKINITYLYSEVMPYAIAVMRALVAHCNATVSCIYWDKKKDTPFIPDNESGITFFPRSVFNTSSLINHVEKLAPDIIYVSGTMDKEYLKAALYFRARGVKVVSGSDAQWLNTAKQKVQSVLSHRLFSKYFEYIWVPGPRQYTMARMLGYKEDKIIMNLLSADTSKFQEAYRQSRESKKKHFPHTLVYVGRFVPVKGIDILYKAFAAAKKEHSNDWKLVLVGGKPGAAYPPADSVEFIDFIPNAEVASRSRDWGVFCLPSHIEPWGVVMHEFAAAGLPIICATSVGAADTFLISGYNGYAFITGSVEDLKKKLLHLMSLTDEELYEMGERSNQLSQVIDPVKSAKSLISVLIN